MIDILSKVHLRSKLDHVKLLGLNRDDGLKKKGEDVNDIYDASFFYDKKLEEEFKKPLDTAFIEMHQTAIRIKVLGSEYSSSTLSKQEIEISSQMDKSISRLLALQNNVKSIFDSFKIYVDDQNAHHNEEPETRMMQIIFSQYLKEFSIRVEEIHEAKSYYQDMIRNRTFRQSQLLNKHLTQAEFDEIMKNPMQNTQGQICEHFLKMPSSQLSSYITGVKEKYAHLVKLEKDINVIHQLFIEVSLIVAEQSRAINSIVKNIQNAADYNRKTVKVLEKEKVRHKKSRKKQCCILMLGLMIIVIITLSFTVFKK